MTKKIENWYPSAISGIITIIVFCVHCFSSLDVVISLKRFIEILNITINITAIILGFVSTTLGIISSMFATRVMKIFRRQGVSTLLYRYFKESFYSGALLLAFSFLFIMYSDQEKYLGIVIFLVWLGLIVHFVLASGRIIYLIVKTIEVEEKLAVQKENKKAPPELIVRENLPDDIRWDPENDD